MKRLEKFFGYLLFGNGIAIVAANTVTGESPFIAAALIGVGAAMLSRWE